MTPQEHYEFGKACARRGRTCERYVAPSGRCRYCARDATLWRYFPCTAGEHAPWPDYKYVTDDSGRMVRVN